LRTPLGFAVLGWNDWSAALTDRLAALPDVEVCWVCDPAGDVPPKRLASRLGARLASLTETVFEDESVDAVVVASPFAARFGHTAAALKAEKHVLVRPPLARRLQNAEELIELAHAHDRLLFSAETAVLEPAITTLKERLARQVGEIYCYDCTWTESRVSPDPLWTFASADIAAVLYLAGDQPIHVQAVGESYLAHDSLDVLNFSLVFATGITAHFAYSRVDARPLHRIAAIGAACTAEAALEPVGRLSLFGGHSSRPHAPGALSGGDVLTVGLPCVDPWQVLCEQFVREARGSRSRLVPDPGSAVVEVLEGLERSLASGGTQAALDGPSRPLRPRLELHSREGIGREVGSGSS
jgi:predicted dehydrogenase